MRGRMLAVTALSSVLLGATAFAAPGRAPTYTLRATETCLASLPNAFVGLPPASPPAAPWLFVDALSRDAVLTSGIGEPKPRPHRQLAVWAGGGRTYEGVVLSFFRTVGDARASRKALTWVFGGTLMGKVVASWDQKSGLSSRIRKAVFACVRSHVPRRRGPRRPAPAASLATFAGSWGGHDRGLSISAAGRGAEEATDGCCRRAYRLVFQIFSVSGRLTGAAARYRVLGFMSYDSSVRGLRVGEVGTLVLRDGIVRNSLTDDYFCSGPGWATGACGA